MINIMSFGSKFAATVPGHVKEEDTYDCRHLRNPWYVLGLRDLNGLNSSVRKFVQESPGFDSFMDSVYSKVPMDGSDKTYAFFCIGGRHRSVVCAESLALFCRECDLKFFIKHIVLDSQIVGG